MAKRAKKKKKAGRASTQKAAAGRKRAGANKAVRAKKKTARNVFTSEARIPDMSPRAAWAEKVGRAAIAAA